MEDSKMLTPSGSSPVKRGNKERGKEESVHRYLLFYSRTGPARYLSHLDTGRVLAIALRRAGLPLALTSGFNPRPIMEFAPPLPVGVAAEREPVLFALKKYFTPAEITIRLNNSLPPGFAVQAVGEWDGQTRPAHLTRARYRLQLKARGRPVVEWQRAVKRLLAAPHLPVERKSEKGTKTVDIRPGLYELQVEEKGTLLVLTAVLATGTAQSVRPWEVAALLLEQMGWDRGEAVDIDVTRVGWQ